MDGQIKDIIDLIKFNAEISLEASLAINHESKDYFARHKANEIKIKQEAKQHGTTSSFVNPSQHNNTHKEFG